MSKKTGIVLFDNFDGPSEVVWYIETDREFALIEALRGAGAIMGNLRADELKSCSPFRGDLETENTDSRELRSEE